LIHQLPHRDLVYLAENGLLRMSVRLFGVEIECGIYGEGADGEWFTVPQERRRFTGFQDLLELNCILFDDDHPDHTTINRLWGVLDEPESDRCPGYSTEHEKTARPGGRTRYLLLALRQLVEDVGGLAHQQRCSRVYGHWSSPARRCNRCRSSGAILYPSSLRTEWLRWRSLAAPPLAGHCRDTRLTS
jgi:hypothetical protein